MLTGATIQQMTGVLRLVPGSSLYARVDGVLRNGRFLLMEVELNEPGLGLHLAPGADERFSSRACPRSPTRPAVTACRWT